MATCKTPVTSLVRFTSAAETTPATALRIPLKEPKVKPVDTVRRDVEAVPVTAILVVVALVVVELVYVAPDPVIEPESVRLPADVILLAELKNCKSPVALPWRVSELVVLALKMGLVPPRIRFPLESTGI